MQLGNSAFFAEVLFELCGKKLLTAKYAKQKTKSAKKTNLEMKTMD